MTRRIIDLDAPERCVVGQEADDEEAAFYLQAVGSGRVISVALDQQQVALLGGRLLVILGELERRGLMAIEVEPPVRPETFLPYPVHEEFHAGTLTIGWDNDSSRVIVEAIAFVPDGGAGESAPPPDPAPEEDGGADSDDDPLGPDLLRLHLTPLVAQRFARQALRAARGRP